MADVSSTWLGTYWQQGIPTRFEVTLIQSGHTLTGRMLDDSDLGEAQLTGEVVGRRINFIKRYFTTSPDPITYLGTISDKEDYMQGQWSIKLWDSGSWEAQRSGNTLIADLQTRIQKKVSLTKSVINSSNQLFTEPALSRKGYAFCQRFIRFQDESEHLRSLR